MSTSDMQRISLDQIRENPVALRGLNRESESYLGLVNSIREKGFNSSITVRPQTDPDTGEAYFEILDGLHRYNAAKDAGLTEVPCIIKQMSKDQAMEWQVMANVHKIETRPIEFTQALHRMMSMNPTMTVNEIATKLAVSPSWITARLGLLKIAEKIQPLVDEGKIGLSNAYSLAKLAPEEQQNFLERAMSLPPSEFGQQVNARAKEIRDARRQGRDPNAETFKPVAHVRKMSDIQNEIANPETVNRLIVESNVTAPKEVVRLTLQWVLNLDPKSVSAQKAKYDEREAKKKADAEKRKLEREAKKQKEAEEAAAKIRNSQ